ncbi:uncharacterized protein K460DRAFT_269333 [Cucurbitaria berberidis CBS 394.84]|uniref:Uncharacterized protein n=1 Tax=Cucurbitaria berberidis CBS 394.84 TaxID=1168544 RepID=A0A9P4GUQ0_9PLEO|nr:uncharacterized protein K460DRAFT_269333 [Cucurbitaria berberidis CBS 394.84]KAF1851619.1 hypothetical protein K460DRAFT_269333 [Cucurbitaria berberidis CBS 394.84]
MTDQSKSDDAPKHPPFSGEAFSNNLLTDLAPLLTLFGEQVTKQFLTLSMGWADNILIALGPLGIMTILVSTIRVGGERRLKAIIGRAREGRATAEAEILSSTSNEVCEMWNGNEIIRTYGSPKTRQIVIVQEEDGLRCYPIVEACHLKYLVEKSGRNKEDFERLILEGVPNLTLNAPRSIVSKHELWLWASVGIVLQGICLAFPAILKRSYGWRVPLYGYVCYILGTAAVGTGLALCSHVIEASTTELEFIPNPEKRIPLQIITIQEGTTVGEQRFSSYLSTSAPKKQRICLSTRNVRNYRCVG